MARLCRLDQQSVAFGFVSAHCVQDILRVVKQLLG
jgi:hypothetical protein